MEYFNSSWKFMLEGETDWQTINLPHDWLIGDVKNLYKSGVGIYKKMFHYDTNEKIFLHFDGVYQDSVLYVNAQKVGERKHGYTAFYFDITDFLIAGENEIQMTVRYDAPNSRWYSGAGIYRDVFLERKNADAYFIPNGIYVTTKKECDHWRLEINAEVEASAPKYEVRHMVTGYLNENPISYSFVNPRLWDINDPYYHVLISLIVIDEKVVDTVRTHFGFREIEFSPENGFFLNGRRVQINGVCQHHDLGGLGAAMHKDALVRQLTILKEMGVNAIRTAHNPPAKIFMELCDAMGFLVMSEFTDMWRRPKTAYDYARFFDEWYERDVAAWVRRDRNCPSLIMWSIGNEIHDTHADPADGIATMKKLIAEVKRNDPDGHALPTFCSNYLAWKPTQKCADIIKLVGYNYAEFLYEKHRAAYPDWVIYGGETASTVQSRSVYHFPYAKAILSDDDLQCSSLGNSTTSWGAKSTDKVIADHRDNMGQFIWTGTDYIGEPTPYSTKNSYFGQIDTAGFPKDAFYIYQAAWTDYKTAPMIHLFPYWDWSPGQPIDVRIASNAPKTELFLNGKSLGTGADFIVPYEKGCLKAVAYDENGKIIAECEKNSFGDAKKFIVETKKIGELIFAEISAVDENGIFCENANNRVKVKVNGGELRALDNGDSTDYDQYQGTDNRRLFGGKLLAIATGGVTAAFENGDVPIRKIELRRSGFEITAEIHPANATHKDIQWRLSDASGIDSPLGKLTVSEDGKTASLQPKGDGEVYIRCTAENGKGHVDLISVLPITVSGYGQPFLDPYSFISAGLYTPGHSPLAAGIERGVATAQTGETQIVFENMDFGAFGTNEITLWIFELGNKPLPIEIWRGIPGTGRLISTEIYDITSIWNTYQPATYTLPEKLSGVQTLSFVFKDGVHLKGFVFKSKTYEKIPFTACDSIYGDSYNITKNAIENIGNNVSITFNDMNFEKPAEALEIRWRSALVQNSIKVSFTDTDGNTCFNMLSLPLSENYTSAVFPLPTPFSGTGAVNFTFLPGSSVDLEMFKFAPQM